MAEDVRTLAEWPKGGDGCVRRVEEQLPVPLPEAPGRPDRSPAPIGLRSGRWWR